MARPQRIAFASFRLTWQNAEIERLKRLRRIEQMNNLLCGRFCREYRVCGPVGSVMRSMASLGGGGDGIQIVVEEVGVGVEGHRRRRMPGHSLHGLHVRTGAGYERCGGVTGIVRRESRDRWIDSLRAPDRIRERSLRTRVAHVVDAVAEEQPLPGPVPTHACSIIGARRSRYATESFLCVFGVPTWIP
ncbi:hypothetical protein [Microbacterium hominis]